MLTDLWSTRICAVAFGGILFASQTVSALDWPCWRGPERSGVSSETGWKAEFPGGEPRIQWKASVQVGFSAVAVADGRLYTAGNNKGREAIVCLNADTGAEIWRHEYDEDLSPRLYEGGPNATPAVDAGVVFMISKTGKVFALDASNGAVRWSVDLSRDPGVEIPEKEHWGIAGSPLVRGGRVIVNAGRAGMALDRETGRVVWSTGNDPCAYGSPVPFKSGGKDALAIFAGTGLVVLDEATGRELWEFPWKTSWQVNAADPIIRGTQVLISSGYNSGAALIDFSQDTPREVWKNKNMRNQMSGSVRVGESIYGFDESTLRCLDWSTGAVRWSEQGLGKGALMAADGKLIILAERGELVIANADPGKFETLARGQVLGGKCWTMPVLANGRIYCRNAAGDLAAVDVRP